VSGKHVLHQEKEAGQPCLAVAKSDDLVLCSSTATGAFQCVTYVQHKPVQTLPPTCHDHNQDNGDKYLQQLSAGAGVERDQNTNNMHAETALGSCTIVTMPLQCKPCNLQCSNTNGKLSTADVIAVLVLHKLPADNSQHADTCQFISSSSRDCRARPAACH